MLVRRPPENEPSRPDDGLEQYADLKLSEAQLRTLGRLCRGNAYLVDGRWRMRGCCDSFLPATIARLLQAGLAVHADACGRCVRITKRGRAVFSRYT